MPTGSRGFYRVSEQTAVGAAPASERKLGRGAQEWRARAFNLGTVVGILGRVCKNPSNLLLLLLVPDTHPRAVGEEPAGVGIAQLYGWQQAVANATHRPQSTLGSFFRSMNNWMTSMSKHLRSSQEVDAAANNKCIRSVGTHVIRGSLAGSSWRHDVVLRHYPAGEFPRLQHTCLRDHKPIQPGVLLCCCTSALPRHPPGSLRGGRSAPKTRSACQPQQRRQLNQ